MDYAESEFVDKLGPEPFEIEETKFIKILSRLRKPVKIAIMDQEIISEWKYLR